MINDEIAVETRSDFPVGGESRIREMLLFVILCLVEHPDHVEVVLSSHPEGSTFCIHAHPADVAKLTENGGRTARALECILGASGRKLGRRLTLNIVQGTYRLQ